MAMKATLELKHSFHQIGKFVKRLTSVAFNQTNVS